MLVSRGHGAGVCDLEKCPWWHCPQGQMEPPVDYWTPHSGLKARFGMSSCHWHHFLRQKGILKTPQRVGVAGLTKGPQHPAVNQHYCSLTEMSPGAEPASSWAGDLGAANTVKGRRVGSGAPHAGPQENKLRPQGTGSCDSSNWCRLALPSHPAKQVP